MLAYKLTSSSVHVCGVHKQTSYRHERLGSGSGAVAITSLPWAYLFGCARFDPSFSFSFSSFGDENDTRVHATLLHGIGIAG